MKCTHPHLKRERLPDERIGKTWKVKIGDIEQGVQLGETITDQGPVYIKAYIRTGEYLDGSLGEVFISPDKEGSFMRGVLDGFALLLSIALQYGVPLDVIVEKFLHARFEPSGMTNDGAVPIATSFFDLMFRKLALQYLDKETLDDLGVADRSKTEGEEIEGGQNGTRKERHTTGLSGEPFNKAKESSSKPPETIEGGSGKEASEGA
jgi:hypothetical protein